MIFANQVSRRWLTLWIEDNLPIYLKCENFQQGELNTSTLYKIEFRRYSVFSVLLFDSFSNAAVKV